MEERKFERKREEEDVPGEIFGIMSELHVNEFLEVSCASPPSLHLKVFFMPVLTPRGEKKFQRTKKCCCGRKAIINFFWTSSFAVFFPLHMRGRKKKYNFLHVREEQLLFVFGKINCILRELISEVIYVGTSLGGDTIFMFRTFLPQMAAIQGKVFFFRPY